MNQAASQLSSFRFFSHPQSRMGLEVEYQPQLDLPRQIGAGEEQRLRDLALGGRLDAMQSGIRPGEQVKVTVGGRHAGRASGIPDAADIEHVADAVEVDSVEQVGGSGGEVEVHATVTLDVERLPDLEISGGIRRS